ncbi:unnamed protein product [Paramecium primaurelia]|uniref:Uncharacterized protein n=1 Tax=Paramecium primaurelia TaxID=5886 RepID=A0A8S1KYK2_PARPR|nr:unnamed protein product [Paramecium primaurelia]
MDQVKAMQQYIIKLKIALTDLQQKIKIQKQHLIRYKYQYNHWKKNQNILKKSYRMKKNKLKFQKSMLMNMKRHQKVYLILNYQNYQIQETKLFRQKNKFEQEQKLAQSKFQKLKLYYQQEKTKKVGLKKQIQQLNLLQTGLRYEINELNQQIEQLKKDIENKQQDLLSTQQLLDKNQDDMKKLTQDLIQLQLNMNILFYYNIQSIIRKRKK